MVGWRCHPSPRSSNDDARPRTGMSCQVAGALEAGNLGIWICCGGCLWGSMGVANVARSCGARAVHGQPHLRGAGVSGGGRMNVLPDAQQLARRRDVGACLRAASERSRRRRRFTGRTNNPVRSRSLGRRVRPLGDGGSGNVGPDRRRRPCVHRLGYGRSGDPPTARWRASSVQTLGPHPPSICLLLEQTDTNSLSLGARILESAMVLGQPGPKHSNNRSMVAVEDTSMLGDAGPLEPMDRRRTRSLERLVRSKQHRTEEVE